LLTPDAGLVYVGGDDRWFEYSFSAASRRPLKILHDSCHVNGNMDLSSFNHLDRQAGDCKPTECKRNSNSLLVFLSSVIRYFHLTESCIIDFGRTRSSLAKNTFRRTPKRIDYVPATVLAIYHFWLMKDTNTNTFLRNYASDENLKLSNSFSL
jgi:hypothetical protein